jgi:hypothetical protein
LTSSSSSSSPPPPPPPPLIPHSFEWLVAFHLEMLQAVLYIAVQLSAAVFLATCFKYYSRGLLTAIFPDIAPSRIFTTNSLCLTECPIHEWLLFFNIFKSNLASFALGKLPQSLFYLSILFLLQVSRKQ